MVGVGGQQSSDLNQGVIVNTIRYERTAEIISALPKLTEAQRREVQAKLLEFSLQNEDVKQCDAAAIQGARLLDRMEEEDGRRSQG